MSRWTRFTAGLLSMALATGCSSQLNLGDSILWSAEHEASDLAEWMADGKGSHAADGPDTAVAISTDFAHGGTHSVKLTNAAVAEYQSASLWRQDEYPEETYYSAWFYLPRSFQTTAAWIIVQLRVPAEGDAGTTLLVDVGLRSLPGGEMILTVFDHRDEYLGSPTPDPALPVPVGRWFQIETLYRNSAEDGRLTLWLDGKLNYDIQRPFGLHRAVHWSIGSQTMALTPTSSTIYVDDAAISLTRVTPSGRIR